MKNNLCKISAQQNDCCCMQTGSVFELEGLTTFLETERYMPFLKYYSHNIVTLSCGNELLLIGCGAPVDQIFYEVRQRYPAKGIIGILLLHNQNDHIRSAEKISYRCQIPVLATAKTLTCCCFSSEIQTITLPASIGSFAIETFPVKYDVLDPVGTVISFEGKQVGIVLDGRPIEESVPTLQSCTHLFLGNCASGHYTNLTKAIQKRRSQLYPSKTEQQFWLRQNGIVTSKIIMKERFSSNS